MATEATICEIIDIRNNRLLLKHATRGISKGKWNGPGGRIEDGETPEQSCIREVEEETGLTVRNLFYHGTLNFYNNGESEVGFAVHLFSTKEYSGTLKQSEEGEVKWFSIRELPLEKMWQDDKYWIEHLLQRKRFDADFYFDKDNKNIISHEIRFKS